MLCHACHAARAIRGTDESVFAEGAGVGGRNRVGYWGDNNWEDNTGNTNQKVGGAGRIFSNSIKLMLERQKFTPYQQEMLLQRAKITLYQQDMLLERQKSTLYQHAAREAKIYILPA